MCKEGAFMSDSNGPVGGLPPVSLLPDDPRFPQSDPAPEACNVLKTSWYREGYWRSQVAAWRASGLNIDEYCRHHDIPLVQLNYWQKKF